MFIHGIAHAPKKSLHNIHFCNWNIVKSGVEHHKPTNKIQNVILDSGSLLDRLTDVNEFIVYVECRQSIGGKSSIWIWY